MTAPLSPSRAISCFYRRSGGSSLPTTRRTKKLPSHLPDGDPGRDVLGVGRVRPSHAWLPHSKLWASEDMPIHHLSVQRVGGVVISGARTFDRAGEAWVLRSLMDIHEKRDVPCFLVTQCTAETEGHVCLDKPCCVLQLMHPCAPIERLGSPKRWEDRFPVRRLALAIGAVT